MTDNNHKHKHIAMWSCSRSLSTVTARAFEQLDECLLIDGPFYVPYLIATNSSLPEKQEILDNWERDPHQIINQITAELPPGKTFSFQRHIAKNVLPEFGRDWLKSLQHFFLIRHPKKIIMSYYKAMEKYPNKQEVTIEDIGLKYLYDLFRDVKSEVGLTPLVIDADDLAKNPTQVLSFLCNHIGVEFSEKMVDWKQSGLQNSTFLNSSSPNASEIWKQTWYSTISKSQGFLPYKPQEINLPEKLIPLLEESLPFYEKLYSYKKVFVF